MIIKDFTPLPPNNTNILKHFRPNYKQTLFTKQPEAVKAYEKYGLKYPYEQFDRNHEDFLGQTAKSPDLLNFKIITKLMRIRSNSYVNLEDNKNIDDEEQIEGSKAREYLVYDLNWKRTDALGNQRHSYQPNLGVIPKLQPVTVIRQDKNGWEEKYIQRVNIVGKVYTILFTKENLNKLIKELGEGCLRDLSTEEGRNKAAKDQMKREKYAAEHNKAVYQPQENEWTHLMIQREGDQRKYTVSSFEDFCKSDFDDLLTFGHTPTKEERERRLAAEEVRKAQHLAAAADFNLSEELDKAMERQRSGVPYK
jgi:hypothetical protein